MPRKPRKDRWLGEIADLTPLHVSFREYGIRLDRIAEALYDEFRQLSQVPLDEREQPSLSTDQIHADSTSTRRSKAPVQEEPHGKLGNAP